MRQKLYQSYYYQELPDAAIAYVKQYNYIDYLRYAKAYLRTQQNKKSMRALLRELLQKGVPQNLAEQAIGEAEETDEDAMIQKWIQKKHYDKESADDKEKQRMYAFLMRRGFSAGAVLRQL